MASKVPRLTPKGITANALRLLLTRIGSASSGTKDTLQDRFRHDIGISRFYPDRPEWQARQSNDKARKVRIVSIDMGIKNLAFCEADVHCPSSGGLEATMDILRWEKIDLVKTTSVPEHYISSPKVVERGATEDDEHADPYSLPTLSATAYSLITKTILTGAPDIILIEKQRWRSGGGSAVLQWTVRVNTLEGMLWAVLQTLRSEQRTVPPKQKKTDDEKHYQVFAVDPIRMGPYWLAQTGPSEEDTIGAELKSTKKIKAKKKARIDLLRSWLASTPASTASTTHGKTPSITFNIRESAERSRKAVCSLSKPARSNKKSRVRDEEPWNAEPWKDAELKKLDDLTDCFLQAAAWVSWELNRLQLQEVRNKTQTEDGSIPEISKEMMLEMVKEVEG